MEGILTFTEAKTLYRAFIVMEVFPACNYEYMVAEAAGRVQEPGIVEAWLFLPQVLLDAVGKNFLRRVLGADSRASSKYQRLVEEIYQRKIL